MKDKTNMEIVFFINKLLKDAAKSNEWMGFDYLMAVKRYIYEGVEVIPEKNIKNIKCRLSLISRAIAL